jgi:sugar phosphate isomerase/epimerase
MELGVVSAVFADWPFEKAARRVQELGLKFIELGAGGFFPKTHCDPAVLLADQAAWDKFRSTLAGCELTVSALAMHGAPLHPSPQIAETYEREFRQACVLAEKLGVGRITLLAGLPAAAPEDRTPNWILFPFPPSNLECYEWQWEERVIPYWKEHATIAADHGVRLCFEMVPADIVYNPETLLRLRDAVGPVAGCNFDPSHLFWQGIDPLEAIRTLGSAIYHAHAKDSRLEDHNVRLNGVLDPKSFQDHAHRSWLFRAVGYGHGEPFWRDFVSTLRLAGYDDVLSIEHEDSLMDPDEGLSLAVRLLQGIVLRKPPAKIWSD